MSFFSNLSMLSKIAAVFFILGKLMFIPAVVCIFTGNKSTAGMIISMYIIFILLSILLSLSDVFYFREKNHYNPAKDGIYNGEFKVLIKDGKIIKIL